MYDRILLPTDGSDNAALATDRSIELATRYDATLHVLYVAERVRDDPTEIGFEEQLTEALRDGRDIVDSVTEQAADNGVETERTVESGIPRTTIEKYADEHDIDLIVMGSTGASDVTEKLLGTVSKYVVNEAPADVLAVRPDTVLS